MCSSPLRTVPSVAPHATHGCASDSQKATLQGRVEKGRVAAAGAASKTARAPLDAREARRPGST